MELVKINASEYGLEESKAKEIEAQFKPMLNKMTELEKEYNKILKLEINQETCIKAKELRLKYVKVRTGTVEIHKNQKSFYLAGGRFVDGWKNAQLFASQGNEDNLMAIEKHYENIEIERVKNLQEKRQAQVNKYEPDMIVDTLGIMQNDVWNNYINGVKLNYESRIAAEKEAEEKRIAEEKAKIAEEKRIRAENERLEKEAKESEIKAAKERKEYESKLRKEREIREKAEAEERQKREKLQAELKAKDEAERKEKQRLLDIEQNRIKAEKAALLAPDKDKLITLSKRIMSIEMPELKTKEANDIMLYVIDLLSKVDSYIKEKVQNL